MNSLKFVIWELVKHFFLSFFIDTVYVEGNSQLQFAILLPLSVLISNPQQGIGKSFVISQNFKF